MVRPDTVADTVERNTRTLAGRLGIRERSAWRHFDPAGLAAGIAAGIAQQRQAAETSSTPGQVGRELCSVIVNVAANAWMAGHIHVEDGCTGCQNKRPTGTDWQARMDTITAMQPDITKWFNREVWTHTQVDTVPSVPAFVPSGTPCRMVGRRRPGQSPGGS